MTCAIPDFLCTSAMIGQSLVTISYQTLAVMSVGPTDALLGVGLAIIAVMYQKHTSADGAFVRLSSSPGI